MTVGVVIRVDFGGPQPGDVVADPKRMLTGPEVAALLGIEPVSWRSLVRRKLAPVADDPGGEGPPNTRRPRWRLSTIREFKQSRKGRGYRSDLAR